MEISDAGIGYNSKLGRLFQIKHMSVRGCKKSCVYGF